MGKSADDMKMTIIIVEALYVIFSMVALLSFFSHIYIASVIFSSSFLFMFHVFPQKLSFLCRIHLFYNCT